jgi:hypothetical protein
VNTPLAGLPGRALAASVSAPDSNHDFLARMIEILAPGERDLVAFLECYFDESGSHGGSQALCLAGYVFEKENCKTFDLGWKQVLDQFRLPYFRMSACAHMQRPFDHLTREETIEVEKAMIALINEHAMLGLAITVNEADYTHFFGPNNPAGGPYSFCCWQILAGIQNWISKNKFEGEISYFYEAGHASQPEANRIMNRIFSHPRLRARYHYASHTFADKTKLRPLQAADLLAWQWNTQMKRWLKNDHRIRADFQALAAKPKHEMFIGNRKTLGPVIAYDQWTRGLPVRGGVTGLWGSFWFWCPYDGSPGTLF